MDDILLNEFELSKFNLKNRFTKISNWLNKKANEPKTSQKYLDSWNEIILDIENYYTTSNKLIEYLLAENESTANEYFSKGYHKGQKEATSNHLPNKYFNKEAFRADWELYVRNEMPNLF